MLPLDREIQVVIVGAGIGGLSLAGFFSQIGIQPVVIEADEELDQQGNVIELWPEATALLEQLSVANSIRDSGTVITEWKQRYPDGTVGERIETDAPSGFVAIRYGDLREQLRDHVGPELIRTGVTLRSLDASEHPVTVTFENGVREKFDLVIGADGANSRTRALIGGPATVACETVSCTFPLPAGTDLSGLNEIWTAGGTVFRALSTGGHPTGLLTAPADTLGDGAVDPTAISDAGAEIDWLLPEAVAMTSCEDVWSARDIRVPTDSWAAGRVALVGDAAQSHHRLAGVGPTLAVEDAAVLVSELIDREDALSARLADYAARRRSRVRRLSDPPEDGSSRPLRTVEAPFSDDCPEVLDIRRNRLAATFGSGTP